MNNICKIMIFAKKIIFINENWMNRNKNLFVTYISANKFFTNLFTRYFQIENYCVRYAGFLSLISILEQNVKYFGYTFIEWFIFILNNF